MTGRFFNSTTFFTFDLMSKNQMKSHGNIKYFFKTKRSFFFETLTPNTFKIPVNSSWLKLDRYRHRYPQKVAKVETGCILDASVLESDRDTTLSD